jgi:hypothetical protein
LQLPIQVRCTGRTNYVDAHVHWCSPIFIATDIGLVTSDQKAFLGRIYHNLISHHEQHFSPQIQVLESLALRDLDCGFRKCIREHSLNLLFLPRIFSYSRRSAWAS